jgi:hypothetical protein
MSAKRHGRNKIKLPAMIAWLALAGSAHAQTVDSVIAQAATEIRATPDERAQTVRMSELLASLGERPKGSLTDDDINDLGALAAGANINVADMATRVLGCEGARATFVLPVLERRLTDTLVNKPAFYSGVQSDEFLRVAIWRIRTNTTCDRPTPDVMSRVSPVAVG